MNNYRYLRKSIHSDPVNYSYSLYGGDVLLDTYFSIRTNAIRKISSDLSSSIERKFRSMGFEKQIEFIVFDNTFNDSFYVSNLNVTDFDDFLHRGKKYCLGNAENRSSMLYLEYLDKLKDNGSCPEDKLVLQVSVFEEKKFITEEILKLIIISRIDNTLVKVTEEEEIISQLSRKYEVFQRLFSSYNASYKKTSDDVSNLSNYCLLGIIMADIYEKKENLRYLNTLLKINDLLTCVGSSTVDLNVKLLSLVILKKEASLIKLLRRNVGKA